MQKLDNDSKSRISSKIADIERKTNSELICLIAPQSARYFFFPLFLSALVALFSPILEPIIVSLGFTEFMYTFEHQTIFFLLLAALFMFTPFNMFLTPKWLRTQNCTRFSVEQFFAHRVDETKDRSGVLIFVSWKERFVTVVADKGITEKVDQAAWDDLIIGFTQHVKNKKIEQGFLEMIDKSGRLLIDNFPAKAINEDELPNHLIEITRPNYIS